MKNIIAFLCLVTIVFSVCSCEYIFWGNESTSDIEGNESTSDIEGNESTEDEKIRIFSLTALTVYKKGEQYLVIGPGKQVEFSSDRECCKIQGFELIKNEENIERFLSMSWLDIITELGPVHADTGSGLSIPSYITEKGYLIRFSRAYSGVSCVTVYDLLTGEMVDQVRATVPQ